MAISQVKCKKYVKFLYEGLCNRYNNNPKSTGTRISPDSYQGEKVVRVYNRRCGICNLKYDPAVFEIHHKDGDRSNTITENLALLCKHCHSRVTKEAMAQFKDYKIESKRLGGAKSTSTKNNSKATPKKANGGKKKRRRSTDLMTMEWSLEDLLKK